MMHLLDDAGVTTWAEAALLAPAAFAAAEDAQRLMWDRGDAMLLELARLRIAQLIGATTAHALHSTRARGAGLTDEMVADLRQWPTSPLFGERERLCLALTEQFIVDVNGITDEQVAAVVEAIGAAECHAFVSALWAFEQLQRVCLVLGVEPPAVHLGDPS